MMLTAPQHVYFIGIGGIGMSGLARYFHHRGVRVSGYDKTETELTKTLAAAGIAIDYHAGVDHLPADIDLVVYTPAVPDDHPAFAHLRARGLTPRKRAEVLGRISREGRTLAVAGTHGKTTTSCLLAHLLHHGGMRAHAFLGGVAANFGSNYVPGSTDWTVVEADEYDRSFLHLQPEAAVILSMDPDHLDIYGDAATIQRDGYGAFAKLVSRALYVRAGLETQLPEGTPFGIDAGAYRATNVRVANGRFVFDYVAPQLTLRNLSMRLPGRHNVENAVAAITLALYAGLPASTIAGGLQSFRGIQRRFEILYEDDRTVYIDDYAHHPTELRAAIETARALYPQRRLTGVFQPHLYSRTRDFRDGFTEALDLLDELWLLPIYPARELPLEGVRSDMLLPGLTHATAELLTPNAVLAKLATQRPEVLLTLGAGDIDRLRSDVVAALVLSRAEGLV